MSVTMWFMSCSNVGQETDGSLFFAVMGDSIAAGRGEVAGTTPEYGTMKEFDGSDFIDIIDSDVSTAVQGSPWPKFGIDLNAALGKTVILSCSGYGGSEWTENNDANLHWDSWGSLYSPAITKINSALTKLRKSKPDGILIILGVNDARGISSMSDIQTGMNSLIDRLNADFDTPNIYIAQIGREESGDTNRVLDVRKLLYNDDANYIFNDGLQHGLGLVQRYSNVYMAYDQMPNFTILGYMSEDNLHPTQEGNNAIGEGFANFIINL